MDCKKLSTVGFGYALCRRLAICMLSVGLATWTVPVAAQDDVAASECANGIVVPNPQDHPALVADCEVLLAIRDQLAGGDHLPWSADTPITEWYGITVRDARVTILDFEDFSDYYGYILSGTIPPELGQLTGLQELKFSFNELTGPIPPELGQL